MLTSICAFDLDGLARSDFMPSRFAVFKVIIRLTTSPEKLEVLQQPYLCFISVGLKETTCVGGVGSVFSVSH